jgi:hypothetical protein
VTAPEVLRTRLEKRPADKFKDIAICQELNADIMKHLHPTDHLIDNTKLTPEQTSAAILEHLRF